MSKSVVNYFLFVIKLKKFTNKSRIYFLHKEHISICSLYTKCRVMTTLLKLYHGFLFRNQDVLCVMVIGNTATNKAI